MSVIFFGFIVEELWQVINAECDMPFFQPQCSEDIPEMRTTAKTVAKVVVQSAAI